MSARVMLALLFSPPSASIASSGSSTGVGCRQSVYGSIERMAQEIAPGLRAATIGTPTPNLVAN